MSHLELFRFVRSGPERDDRAGDTQVIAGVHGDDLGVFVVGDSGGEAVEGGLVTGLARRLADPGAAVWGGRARREPQRRFKVVQADHVRYRCFEASCLRLDSGVGEWRCRDVQDGGWWCGR